MQEIPNLEEIRLNYNKIKDDLVRTPVVRLNLDLMEKEFSVNTNIFFKFEQLQITGTFKLRGVLTFFNSLTDPQKERGVIAGTGGNHGLAVAYASRKLGVNAKIIVPRNINKFRLNAIKSYGANLVFVDDISEIIDVMEDIATKENLTIVHPFNHPIITLGAASLGLEFIEQVSNLDAVIVPIGGGGLASGVSAAVKLINSNCKVYGVEPKGANSMYLSFIEGRPVSLTNGPNSIADSLCSPCSLDYSFSVCKNFIDRIVTVSDDEIRNAMRFLLENLKIAVEPAGATATAGILGELKGELSNKNIGVIVCGSNIGYSDFTKLIG